MINKAIDLIENYREKVKDISEQRMLGHLYDYEFAKAILKAPESPPRDIYDMMCFELYKEIDFFVLGNLRPAGLQKPERRKEWAGLVNKTGHNLALFISEGRNDYGELYEEIKRVAFVRNVQVPLIEPKAILISLNNHLPEQGIFLGPLKELVQQMGFTLAKMFLGDLISLAANVRGFGVRRTLSEKLQGTKDALKDMLRAKTQEYENEKQKLTDVEKENEDFRAALEIVQQQLENLQEEIETIKSDAHQEVVVNFFQQMNSSQSGHLLDQFAISEKSLKELKRRNFTIPVEVESIPALIRMFIRFVKFYGIQEKEKFGVKKINLREADMYDYVGTDFKDENEIKTVEVVTSGWDYGGSVISRPRVVEVFGG